MTDTLDHPDRSDGGEASFDLAPATAEMARVTAGIEDDQLDRPTPSEGVTVGQLLDHVVGLAGVFAEAARKKTGPEGVGGVQEGSTLDPDWRTLLPQRLDALAAAWREPAAWDGLTWAGGFQAPGPQIAAIAVDELVVHAWDLAVATGQETSADPAMVAIAHGFCDAIPDAPEAREGLFGPRVAVPDDASLLDRTLGLSGRDPRWQPPV